MNDVGGSESGTGLRPKSSRGRNAPETNFEYDDSEWDVGIGNLIIDLDADIEKNNEENRTCPSTQQPQTSSTTTSTTSVSSQMHIPQQSSAATPSSSSSNNINTKVSKPGSTAGAGRTGVSASSASGTSSAAVVGGSESNPSGNSSSVNMEHSSTCADKGLKMKIKRTKPGTKSVDAKHEIVKNDLILSSATAGSAVSSSSNASNNSVSASASFTKVASNNTTNDSSNKAYAISVCSNKNVKDKAGVAEEKREGPTTTDTSKLKTPKKISTQKKIKIGGNGSTGSVSNPAGHNTATSVGKKDGIGGTTEFRSHNPVAVSSSNSTTNTVATSSGASSGTPKMELVNPAITIPSVPSSLSSAFAKATPLKVPTQQQCANLHGGHAVQVHDAHAPSVSATSNANQQSLKNTNNAGAFGHIQSTTLGSHTCKGDKQGTVAITTGSNGTSSEKSSPTIGSNNYAKKQRMFAQQDKQVKTLQDSDGSKISTTKPLKQVDQDCSSSAVLVTTSNRDSSSRSSRTISQSDQSNQDACVGTSVGTVTEPDCLGPCEPGTSVTLEGIVWHETENGVLVVNVTWRGKTYVGTLLDCTKNEWASPRFCDSPTSDLETRAPKNRGKRGRAQGSGTPLLETNPSPLDALRVSATKLRNGAKGRRGSSTISAPFLTPLSPLKVDPWPKRKTRGSENDSQEESTATVSKNTKRLKITSKESSSGYPGYLGRAGGSPVSGTSTSATHGSNSSEIGGPYSPALIECPEPNCSKKYKHINGLKYHQSHAHTSQFVPAEDSDSNMSTTSTTNLTPGIADGLLEPPINAAELNEDISKTDIDDADNPIAINVCDESSLSAPTTPVKNGGKAGDDRVYDLNVQDELQLGKIGSDTPLSVTKDKVKTKESESDEKLNDGKEFLGQHMVHLAGRTPILTVPSFVSIQNRPMLQHQVSVPRLAPTQELSILGENQKVDRTSILSKGAQVPWQPHVNSNTSLSHSSQSSPLISSIHSMNAQVQLNVPTTGSDKSLGKDKGSSSALLSTKKPKHKKKSKDKRDRERDGKPRLAGDTLRKDRDSAKNHRGSPNMFSSSGRGRDERKSSSDTLGDEGEGRARFGGDSRDRDDPQSPAYSDISDANDSGPESDLGVGSKEVTKNNIPPGTSDQLGKDANINSGAGGPHSFSSFFSPGLYSPYSLGEGPSGSVIGLPTSAPLNVSMNKSNDRDRADDVSPGKNKSSGHHHSILQGLPDERRSPKMDYHPKYLPQQYYSYPYSNFHGFEQSPYGLLPENPYNAHSRAFIEEKERELQLEQMRKTKPLGEGCKDSPGMLAASQIKQEPPGDRERNQKEPGIKSQSSNNTDGSRRSGNFSASGCSKHQKEYNKRGDKEDNRDRHSHNYSHKSDNTGHKSGNPRSGHHHSERDKQASKHPDKDSLDKEKEREKIEGSKPTMETTGPPPPPTAGSYAYIPPGYLQSSPFGLPFDPLYRQVIVPGPYPGSPYGMHPGGMPRFPPTSVSTPIPLPEDLSRPSAPSSVPVPASKALDLLQHHAAQYYATHKIHELQERALKSPSPQVPAPNPQPAPPSGGTGQSGSLSQSSKPSSPSNAVPAIRKDPATNLSTGGAKCPDLSKDIKPCLIGSGAVGPGSDSSRSPPTQHHVHTHHHSHTHIGYPIIPAVPPQYSPHYPHVIPPSGAPTPVLPTFPSQKPT